MGDTNSKKFIRFQGIYCAFPEIVDRSIETGLSMGLQLNYRQGWWRGTMGYRHTKYSGSYPSFCVLISFFTGSDAFFEDQFVMAGQLIDLIAALMTIQNGTPITRTVFMARNIIINAIYYHRSPRSLIPPRRSHNNIICRMKCLEFNSLDSI